MLQFIDSFDHYGSADIGLKWTAIVGPATIAPTSGRRGGGALRLAPSLTTSLRKDLVGAPTLIFGAAIRLGSFGGSTYGRTFLTFGGTAAQHVFLAVTDDGTVQAYRKATSDVLLGATTAAAVPLGVYFYCELKVTVSATVGTLKVLINGATVLNLINQNTLGAGAAELVTRVTLAAPGTNAGIDPTFFDDLYICDTQGAVNTDFFGDVRVDLLLPNADGTYLNFTPDTGTVHFSRVNELVADASTSVASSTVGHKDSYQFADLAAVAGVIRGVQIVDAALKDDAGARSIAHLVKSGATEVTSVAIPLSTDRKLYTTVQETDPATGAAWTQAGVNGAEFGIVVAA